MVDTGKTLKIAAIQPNVSVNKAANLENTKKLIKQAVVKYNPRIVTLPEFFNSPYQVQHMHANAENVPAGESCKLLSDLAKELNVFIVGGSIPELDGTKVYNTTTVWSPHGDLIAKHRKVHLADVILPPITLRESDVLTAGNSGNTFVVDGIKIGLGICYDSFFNEFSTLYRKKGCKLLLFQSAFPVSAGHYWDLVMRARALDNQVFVVGTSGARDDNSSGFVYWGNSCIVNPDGVILEQAGNEEAIVYREIDFGTQDIFRSNLPMIKHRRTDIYETIDVCHKDGM